MRLYEAMRGSRIYALSVGGDLSQRGPAGVLDAAEGRGLGAGCLEMY